MLSPVAAPNADGTANGYVVGAKTAPGDELMLWHVDDSNGKLVPDGVIQVSSFGSAVSNPVPQPGEPTTRRLDPGDPRLSQAVVHADPDAGGPAIWTQQTIADPAPTSSRSIVRWYELVPGACNAGSGSVCQPGTLRQQGDVTDPANWIFNGAISPTEAGNEAVLHYSVGGPSQLAQVRARSRSSSTPAGQLGAEATVLSSDGGDEDLTCNDTTHSATHPWCRWGDYAGASPDPSAPDSVWGSNQALAAPNGTVPSWKTANFDLSVPQPAPPPPAQPPAPAQSPIPPDAVPGFGGLTALAIHANVGSRSLTRLLKHGLRVQYSSNQRTRASFALSVSGKVADRIRLAASPHGRSSTLKPVAVARTSQFVSPGNNTIVLHLSGSSRSRILRHGVKRLVATLTMTATDLVGKSHTYSLTLAFH